MSQNLDDSLSIFGTHYTYLKRVHSDGWLLRFLPVPSAAQVPLSRYFPAARLALAWFYPCDLSTLWPKRRYRFSIHTNEVKSHDSKYGLHLSLFSLMKTLRCDGLTLEIVCCAIIILFFWNLPMEINFKLYYIITSLS